MYDWRFLVNYVYDVKLSDLGVHVNVK